MKVGTLTFPGSPSHGASLQMYALYKVLEKMEIDVEVINYIPDTVNYKYRPSKSLKDRIAALLIGDSETPFRKFESQIKVSPVMPINTTEKLKEHTQIYDRIIVGSDQVWNPAVTGNDRNYYLEFCEENQKKASYAPSFGIDQVAETDREKIAKLLSKFTYLSAREERGKDLIYELTGRTAPVVFDPTFLIDGEDWRRIKRPSGAKKDYVFIYTIKRSPRLRQTAQSFADKHGYKLVYISGGLHGFLDKLNPIKYPVFGVGPAEFIDLIDNAKYIFTNSFHGAAFSIILNKNFYLELSSDTNSRLITLLKTFQLEDNIIDCGRFDYDLKQINYEKVNQILREKRKESLTYLEGIVY